MVGDAVGKKKGGQEYSARDGGHGQGQLNLVFILDESLYNTTGYVCVWHTRENANVYCGCVYTPVRLKRVNYSVFYEHPTLLCFFFVFYFPIFRTDECFINTSRVRSPQNSECIWPRFTRPVIFFHNVSPR